MSVATIVSGAPFLICETHPQCVPYEIRIPPAKFMEGGLSTLVIEDGYHGLYIDEKRGFMDIPDEGMALANRTVTDILSSQFLFDPDAQPAVFWVPGALTEAEVKIKHPEKVKAALDRQHKWFEVIVRRADAAYNKNHNMAEISDLHRNAAQFLGLERDWVDRSPGSMIPCPACYTMVRKVAAICYACRAIVNEDAYSKIRFAGQEKIVASVPAAK